MCDAAAVGVVLGIPGHVAMRRISDQDIPECQPGCIWIYLQFVIDVICMKIWVNQDVTSPVPDSSVVEDIVP